MNDRERFDELLASARLRLLTFRSFVEELAQQEFTTAGSSDLVSLCYRISFFYDLALQDVGDAYHLFADQKAPKTVLSAFNAELIDIVKQIHELSKATRYADSARVMSTSTDIPAILDTLAKTLGPNISVIVRPQNAYAYEYREVTRHLTKLPQRLLTSTQSDEVPIDRKTQRWFTPESLLDGLSTPLGVINYPKIEGQNILRHTFAVGHELGHFADEVLNIRKIETRQIGEGESQDVSAFLEFKTSDIRNLTESVIDIAQTPEFEQSQLRTDIPKQINARGLRWLSEIVADTVSVNLAGPGAVASFLALALGESSLDFSYKEERAGGTAVSFYPWLRLRLTIMFRVLDALGFGVTAGDKLLSEAEWLEGKLPNLYRRLSLAKAIVDSEDTQEFEKIDRPPWNGPGVRADLDRYRTLESVRIVTDAVKRALPTVFGGDEAFPDLATHTIGRLRTITRNGEPLWVYTRDQCLAEVPALVTALGRNELPSQIMGEKGPTPARFPSIVTAGWEVWLCRSATETDPNRSHQALTQLNTFLAAAIETSQLFRRFALEKKRVTGTT